ncbi:MAG TPA: succinate dehydrogenase assembly factor 2, partial [Afifellaceae bacterium]|nr:succinate dehydrogenase assembly factor 2 [Afifellaceae bacterium]
MTGTSRTTEGLDARRRKALYHSWHRGMREMDLLLGRFADAEIGDLPDADLSDFEQLMEVPDQQLYRWLSGQEPVAANHDTGLFRRIRDFHTGTQDQI